MNKHIRVGFILLSLIFIVSCDKSEPKLFCGDSKCSEGENSQNCPKDCGCSSGYIYEENRCIELQPMLNTNFEQNIIKSITYFKAKERSVGTLSISNSGNSIAKNVKVKISSSEGYFSDEILSFNNINEGGTQSQNINLIFKEKALDIVSKKDIKLNIDLNFEDKDNREHSGSETATFEVMGRNYMSWSKPEEIASWITPNHPTIKEFASKATAGLVADGSSKNRELAARWLLESMRAYGIKYVNDPFNKQGDYVQFPTETLVNTAGDCEDNAILYSSLLSAIGLEPVIYLTPTHAFAGYKDKEGNLVPIETTSLDFDEALERGRINVNKNKNNLRIIRLNWRNNPQVILPVNGNLKIPSITKNIGECKIGFSFSDLFVASVPITFTNSGEVTGAGCAIASIYEEGGVLRDEKTGCWTIQPKETKTVTFKPDISIFNGYYCVAK